jgi:aspartate kinase
LPADLNADPVVVRKYGGSSLATVERIRAVAADICKLRATGARVIVVVSAMGETTDELERLARQANPRPPRRELDMLLSVGERITMSLLSMALADLGCPAISYTGSQCAIITDTSHTNARIKRVRADRVRESLAAGHVVVVAGFQGVSEEREITTLGRGGSDTTAVALAAALAASRCEILKDVPGVMTADPHLVPGALRHEQLSYAQMSELAEAGCGVIHARAVRYAASHGVALFVGSSFEPGPGTRIFAPAAPVVSRPEDYRPLSLVVAPDVALLEVSGAGRGLATRWAAVLEASPPSPNAAERLSAAGDSFHWLAVAPPDVLGDLQGRAVSLGATAHLARDLSCVTLAGGRPAHWLAARERLVAILTGEQMESTRILAEGGGLKLLIPAASLPALLERLHAAFWPD